MRKTRGSPRSASRSADADGLAIGHRRHGVTGVWTSLRRGPRPAPTAPASASATASAISAATARLERGEVGVGEQARSREPGREGRRSDRAASTARPPPSCGTAPGRTSSGRGSGRCAPRAGTGRRRARTRSTARRARRLDGEHVHAVHRLRRHAVGRRPCGRCRSAPGGARAPCPSRRGCSRRGRAPGSFQSAARFSDSWNSPSATAPSPKKQAVTPRAALHLVGQREADGDRQPAADDRVAAVEAPARRRRSASSRRGRGCSRSPCRTSRP